MNTPEMNMSGRASAVTTGWAESNERSSPATAKPRQQKTTTPATTVTSSAGSAPGDTVAP